MQSSKKNVNLSEPLIRTEDFVLYLHYDVSWLYPCEPVVEVANRRKSDVPQHLPGANPFVKEFQRKHNVSELAAMGGPASIYPEFRIRLANGGTSAGLDALAHASEAPRPAQRAPQLAAGELLSLAVQGNIYMLASPVGNMTLQIGPQGVLIVDTLPEEYAGKVLSAIGKITAQKIQYISIERLKAGLLFSCTLKPSLLEYKWTTTAREVSVSLWRCSPSCLHR